MSESKFFDRAFSWRVEYTRRREDLKYTTNCAATVICQTIDQAIAEVYKRWPDATIIKVFRGEHFGHDGVIVVDPIGPETDG